MIVTSSENKTGNKHRIKWDDEDLVEGDSKTSEKQKNNYEAKFSVIASNSRMMAGVQQFSGDFYRSEIQK